MKDIKLNDSVLEQITGGLDKAMFTTAPFKTPTSLGPNPDIQRNYVIPNKASIYPDFQYGTGVSPQPFNWKTAQVLDTSKL